MAKTESENSVQSQNGVYFADIYEKLAAPFDSTFKDVRGGVELEYITGEQCITRLNEVLGVAGWSFRVVEHGHNQESDEFWVLAEMTANFGGTTVVRQQFGSQKVKRSRATDSPLDIGFDLKGATTDALKKCASLLGVGLYLSRKEAPAEPPLVAALNGHANGHANGTANGQAEAQIGDGPLVCAECDQELKEIRFRDGTSWAPLQLANYGRRKHGKVLCMDHYRDANAARKRAEQTVAVGQNLDEIPF